MQHPLKALFDVRRDEVPRMLLMFGSFFLIITTFWILKPIKKTLFIAHYDQVGFQFAGHTLSAAKAELLAKVLNMLVALVATAVFSLLSTRHRRQQLLARLGGFFVVAFIAFAPLLQEPDATAVWAFYMLGDLFSTLMVAAFFVLLADSVDTDTAKRIYGPIGLGGVTGGLFGSTVVRGFIGEVPTPAWVVLCAVLCLLTIALALVAGRSMPEAHPAPEGEEPAAAEAPTLRDAFEGARIVLRSRYLQAIVAIVAIYEMVSTVMDFQFSATIEAYCDGPEIGETFASAFALMNGVAFVVQLGMTSFVMQRFGLRFALMVLPCATLLGSGTFLALPVLWVGALMPTLDSALAFSINQSAKESLYVPTARAAKYRAKAFIDMFVQRTAKAVAVGLSLLITGLVTDFSGVRYLSLLSLALILAWVGAARYVGGRFDEVAHRGAVVHD